MTRSTVIKHRVVTDNIMTKCFNSVKVFKSSMKCLICMLAIHRSYQNSSVPHITYTKYNMKCNTKCSGGENNYCQLIQKIALLGDNKDNYTNATLVYSIFSNYKCVIYRMDFFYRNNIWYTNSSGGPLNNFHITFSDVKV